MESLVEQRMNVETCPNCGWNLQEAAGIGLVCPNPDCEVSDNAYVWPDKPKIKFTPPVDQYSYDKGYTQGYQDAYNEITGMFTNE